MGVFASGCGLLEEQLEDGGATVFIFATHHATPEDGVIPFKGDDDMPRTFENEEGWQVTLLEAYVTISSVSLISCGGAEYPMNMFWGPCPEDLRDEDLAPLTVAGNRVGDDNYCTLRVEYAAYQTPVIDEESDTRHETPANDNVDGTTVYLRGGARPPGGGDSVNFEVASPSTVVVDLDLSDLEGPGRPLNVAHREDFPKELTISKTYDRFFDEVDFENFDPAFLQGRLPGLLEEQTKVSPGTVVTIDD